MKCKECSKEAFPVEINIRNEIYCSNCFRVIGDVK